MSTLKRIIPGILFILLIVFVSGCTELQNMLVNEPGSNTTDPKIAEVGFSRHNPAPLNTTIEFTKKTKPPLAYQCYDIGSDIDGDYTGRLTISEIKRGEEAEKFLSETNHNATVDVEEGKELLLAKVKFELLDMPDPDVIYKIKSLSFDVVTSDGRTISEYFYTNARPDLDAKLYEGASDEGWITLACAINDTKPLLVFENKDGNSGIWFKAYNEEGS